MSLEWLVLWLDGWGTTIYDVHGEGPVGSRNTANLRTNGIDFVDVEGGRVIESKNYVDVIYGGPLGSMVGRSDGRSLTRSKWDQRFAMGRRIGASLRADLRC